MSARQVLTITDDSMLTLRILTYRDQAAPHLPAGFFAETGGTLGRGPDNHLVLDDPGKYISRIHARVTCRDGVFYLEDVGSNPSVVNDRPLGKGREIMLADGDRIAVGDYQLQAGVPAQSQAKAQPQTQVQAPAQAQVQSQVPAPTAASAPLSAAVPAPAVHGGMTPPAASTSLPLFEPPPPRAAVVLPALEGFTGNPPGQAGQTGPLGIALMSHSSALSSGAASSGIGGDLLANASILDVRPGDDFGSGQDDPLGLNLFGAAPGATLPAALPGDLGHTLAPHLRGAESDHASPELVPFRYPQAAPLSGSPAAVTPAFNPAPVSVPRPNNAFVIPDDYDALADLLPSSAARAAPVPVQPAPSLPPEFDLAARPAVPPAADVSAQPPVSDSAPAAMPPGDASTENRTDGTGEEPTLMLSSARLEPMPATAAAAAASARIPAATAVAAAPAASAYTSHSESEILQALLRGLGLPDLQLNRSGVQVAETVGALLREATAGTMDVLMARALTKKESRIDMTMISVNSNNPLKFFPNPDSALTQMLTNNMAGYMPPVLAMQGAFNDLKAHELAVIAGMRAALSAVLQRFDPAKIETRLAEPSMMDKMLGATGRKARMWDRLVELYGEIAREADDDLQRLFGEKFSQAYEEQVERLYRASKQG